MNFKKNWKRFWTLSCAREGFTLVELIVVIAILAILAGVAVPAYSGYVKKANMQADITLISEIEHALTLYYYAHPEEVFSGYVVLSTEGIVNEIAGTNVEEALIATFGAGYADALVLKHDDWDSVATSKEFAEAYLSSSYSGNEDALITQIGSVTNTLRDALASAPNLVGLSFNAYLTDNGIDTTDNQAVSNAAILYAADKIADPETDLTAVNAAFQNFYNPDSTDYGQVGALTLALKDELGTYGAVAALYAHGEAFGQYMASNGNSKLLEDFHRIDAESITDTDDALEQVAANLSNLVYTAQTDMSISPFVMQYVGGGQYANDVTAYLQAMKTINDNAGKFTDKLGSEGCYTDGTAADMLQAAVSAGSLNISCNAGEVAVWINSDGEADNSASDD